MPRSLEPTGEIAHNARSGHPLPSWSSPSSPGPGPGDRRRGLVPACFSLLLLALAVCAPAQAAHGLAQFGELKYPADFSRFDYVDPAATPGGTLILGNPDQRTSFDTLNPFSFGTTAAPGLLELVFETLMVPSADELNSVYGLIAEDVALAADLKSAVFRIDARARFSNGDAISAADIVHSFRLIKSQAASPNLRAFFADLSDAQALDPRHVRVDFTRAGKDVAIIASRLPVISARWGASDAGAPDATLDRLVWQTPIGSGPYLIETVDAGRSIRYRRNPDYWGAGLPSRRGSFNFEAIDFRLYRDYSSLLEAFKAGEFDAFSEQRARAWARSYIGERFDRGEIVKKEFPHQNPAGMSSYAFNLRRNKFQDPRVRQALILAFDFEWINEVVFYNQYHRIESYFPNSEWSAVGPPSEAERSILEPFRDQLDPQVFGSMPRQPTTRPPGSVRENLKEARRLLREAGWRFSDGALRDKAGRPFTLEFFMGDRLPIPFQEAYLRNLEILGVVVQRRVLDALTVQSRRSSFDFDMFNLQLREMRVPGVELSNRYGSAAARRPGSDNLSGIESPVVDALIKRVLAAETKDAMRDATGALDRVLIHGYYGTPQSYGDYFRIAHKRSLAHPASPPPYYAPYDWVMRTWWTHPSEQR